MIRDRIGGLSQENAQLEVWPTGHTRGTTYPAILPTRSNIDPFLSRKKPLQSVLRDPHPCIAQSKYLSLALVLLGSGDAVASF